MPITNTENGVAFGDWEGIPMKLEDGGKLTRCEMRVAVCGASGMTYRETAAEMQCSKNNVDQAWQNLYYKLRCNRRAIAINKLIDLGALRRLLLILLILNAGLADDLWRSARQQPARGSKTRTASRRSVNRMAAGGLLAGMLHQLDQLTGAGDCYTAADVAPFIPWTKNHQWHHAYEGQHA